MLGTRPKNYERCDAPCDAVRPCNTRQTPPPSSPDYTAANPSPQSTSYRTAGGTLLAQSIWLHAYEKRTQAHVGKGSDLTLGQSICDNFFLDPATRIIRPDA